MSDTLDRASIIKHMTSWFLCRYEDPAESCPHDEGEYVYIWGGPCDAREELEHQFGGLVSESIIDAVVEILESDGTHDWSQVPTNDDVDFEPNEPDPADEDEVHEGET